jgi:hypothetical protein
VVPLCRLQALPQVNVWRARLARLLAVLRVCLHLSLRIR